MSEPVVVELFMEDQAHEKLLVPMVKRIAREENVDVHCNVRTALGGHPRAIHEFRLYLKYRELLGLDVTILIVAIDSNCDSFAQTRSTIETTAGPEHHHLLVTACPDPHIERWYMADLNAFHEVVGYQPDLGSAKCDRDHYKSILRTAVRAGGDPNTLGGIEFAPDLIARMDFFRAGRSDRSLKSFVDDLRSKLRILSPVPER